VSQRLRRIRRFYDKDPAGYHRCMSTRVSDWMLARGRRKVGEMVGREGRLLDVGFGTGLSLPHYPAEVEIVGIDASLKMLEFGRVLAEREGRHVELLVMDAERLAFPERSFDSIAFNLSLCTIPDPERAVREALRVAKPGAPMIFLEHVRSHVLPVALLQDLLNPVMVALEADHFNRRTIEIIKRAGVTVDSVDRWFAGVFNLIGGRAPQAY
jgi:ubiquinone/menaquinone biosynthesis C-methylase UbiE